MSSRRPIYLIGVIFFALAFSSPQILIVIMLGAETYRMGRLPPILNGRRLAYGGELTYAPYWQDQFILMEYRSDGGRTFSWRPVGKDPETGKKTTNFEWQTSTTGYQASSFGDRLWFSGVNEWYEVVDGKLRKTMFTPPGGFVYPGRGFLWKGEPATIQNTGSGFDLMTLDSAGWATEGTVDHLSARQLQTGSAFINFPRATWISCLNQGDRVHVFARVNNYILYREGLDLQPTPAMRSNSRVVSEPASALKTENTRDQRADWSLIRQHPVDQNSWNEQIAFLIGGQPAVLLVDQVPDGSRIGKVYRLDGTTWTEIGQQAFPFGSSMFRAIPSRDGQKGYVLVTTSVGNEHVYAVDANGFRKTQYPVQSRNPFLLMLNETTVLPIMALILGTVLGLATWLLMWTFTKPDYGFGAYEAKLASLGQRGAARLIDIVLILLVSAGLGWFLTRGLDWLTLAEAINLQVDHPTLRWALRVIWTVILTLIAIQGLFLVFQARWGLTPGKWICGIRTLRTTLKPAGFARSLVREVVMCVDCCNLLCWAPGILSISLTDRRQRLGDLVADTIVVQAGSIRHASSVD